MKISVVLIAKNEEKKIEKCLTSVTWADEIIVIDDGSTDKTLEIAKKYTKKVYTSKSKGYVEAIRNFGLSKATGDYILLLDADEIVPSTLRDELKKRVENDSPSYIKIPRKNIIFNEWIKHNTGWWPDYQLRFFRNGSVIWPEKIHSQPETSGEGIELEADEKFALYHQNYETISQFLEKLDRYTTIEAQEKDTQPSPDEAVLSPSDEFVSRFFARKGYKDGMHGLVLSFFEAMYAEILFAKRWEKTGFEKKNTTQFLDKQMALMRKAANSIEYWYLTVKIEETTNPLAKARLSLKRKKVLRELNK